MSNGISVAIWMLHLSLTRLGAATICGKLAENSRPFICWHIASHAIKRWCIGCVSTSEWYSTCSYGMCDCDCVCDFVPFYSILFCFNTDSLHLNCKSNSFCLNHSLERAHFIVWMSFFLFILYFLFLAIKTNDYSKTGFTPWRDFGR